MERILTLNIGATRLALAEFEVRSGRGPGLLRYTFGELPEGGAENPEAFSIDIAIHSAAIRYVRPRASVP